MKKTLLTMCTTLLLTSSAFAQSPLEKLRTGASYDEVVGSIGVKPTNEYTVTAVEDRIDPFVGAQTPAQHEAAEARANEAQAPALEVKVAEFKVGGEVIRVVFDEEGAAWYGTTTISGAATTAGAIAEEMGPPKIAQIIRYVGTGIRIFTVFAYPDAGVAWIGAGSTPPFIPNGTFPTVPSSIASTLPTTTPKIPLEEIPLVQRITLPPNTLPQNLDGLVLEDDPGTVTVSYDETASTIVEDAPVKPEPTPTPKKNKPSVTPAPTPAPKKKVVGGAWRSPLASTCVASGFGPRNISIKGASKNHLALDLRAGCGTQVKAARAGTVTFAQWYRGYGYQVRIDHGDGTETRYSHLQKGGFKVKEGQQVSAGDLIALSGNTSSLNAKNKKPLACHLHFETLVRGKKVNPSTYIKFSKCGGRPATSKSNGGNFFRP